MRTALAALGDYLAANGIGTVGTDLFLAQFPQHVLDGVAVVATGGTEATPVRGDYRLRFQVTSRHSNYATASAKAWDAYELLDSPDTPINLSGAVWVLGAKPIQPPLSLGLDDRERWRIVFNVELQAPAR